MRKINKSLDFVKQGIKQLIGQPLHFVINRGRQRLENFDGEVISAFPSIFTIQIILEDGQKKLEAFSYNDILTSNVKIQKLKKENICE